MRETPQSIRLSLLRRELNDALAEVAQLEKWSEGLVIETQRLQGIEAEVERLRGLLRDFDWDETGTPTAWPNRERIAAALRGEGEK